MRKIWISAAALSAALGLAATAQAQPERYGADASAHAIASLTAQDYVDAARRDDLFEIQAAELAQQQANSPAVRSAAGQILAGQKTEAQAMKRDLQGAGMGDPPPPKLTEQQTARLGELHAATGPDFDRMFVEQQRLVGEEALAFHQAYADHGDNGVLRGAAHHAALMVQKRLSLLDDLRGGSARP